MWPQRRPPWQPTPHSPEKHKRTPVLFTRVVTTTTATKIPDWLPGSRLSSWHEAATGLAQLGRVPPLRGCSGWGPWWITAAQIAGCEKETPKTAASWKPCLREERVISCVKCCWWVRQDDWWQFRWDLGEKNPRSGLRRDRMRWGPGRGGTASKDTTTSEDLCCKGVFLKWDGCWQGKPG